MRPSRCHARERQWKNVRERARLGRPRPSVGEWKEKEGAAPPGNHFVNPCQGSGQRIQEQEIKSESCLL